MPSFCTAGGRRPRRAAVLQKVCTSSTARAAAPERLSRAQPSPPHLSQPWQPSCAQGLCMDFVLLHARGPERHACSANMTGLAMRRRMAASRLESGHGTGAAAWKRVELQVELQSGAGAVARVGSHAVVPAGHGRQCRSCSHGRSAQGGCMRV